MKHVHYNEVTAELVPDCPGVHVRWLVGPHDDAPHFHMRRFEIDPGASTPHHTHPHEHEIYVLDGEGTVFGNGKESSMRAGDCFFVPGGETHHFKAGARPVAILCMVPKT